MQIQELISRLQASRPVNFLWGSGTSALYRASITIPGDPEVREAAKKYEGGDPLLSEIKRKFFHTVEGLEDVRSCLLALNDYERKEVLTWQTNWANLCLAELLKVGRAARVLTTNFDGHLVRATANLRLMAPLYRGVYPELQDAATPSIYLLGDAPPETFAGLLKRGAATGPWVVVGMSGKHPGVTEALLSIERFEEGLFWAGHFEEPPPGALGKRFFTSERGAHWISGFDADSLMMYLLRGLAAFPPPSVAKPDREHRDAWLKSFEAQRCRSREFKEVMADVDGVLRAGAGAVRAMADRLSEEFELAARSGHSAFLLGHAARRLADHRSPREARPLLRKAADLMEPEAPGDVMGGFAELCSRLAGYSLLPEARQWFQRSVDAFEQMDFGPSCGAPLPYGHFPNWAAALAAWSYRETDETAEALFEQARLKFQDTVRNWSEVAERGRKSTGMLMRMGAFAARSAESGIRTTIASLVDAFHRRARLIARDRAMTLLEDARPWIERLRADDVGYASTLAKHLFRMAEAAPERQSELVGQASEQFEKLLQLLPDQAGDVYCNQASGLGELGLYEAAIAKFEEAERSQPDSVALHKNWSSILIRQAREWGGGWEQARQRAGRAEELETGEGGYNLACIAGELGERASTERWLRHCAAYGKIPPLAHCLEDVSFAACRQEPWFLELLDEIFDAGLSLAPAIAR